MKIKNDNLKTKKPRLEYFLIWVLEYGAQGRSRTGTVFLPGDFKSPASTNFATWADD